MSLNRVMLLGRLAADVEPRHAQGGQPVTSLRVETAESWTEDGQRRERTEWHSVVAWGATAENCAKFLSKGREVFIEGRLQSRDFEKDGQTRRIWEVIADRVVFLGGAGEQRTLGAGGTARAASATSSGGRAWGGSAERGGRHAPSVGAGLDDDPIPF